MKNGYKSPYLTLEDEVTPYLHIDFISYMNRLNL